MTSDEEIREMAIKALYSYDTYKQAEDHTFFMEEFGHDSEPIGEECYGRALALWCDGYRSGYVKALERIVRLTVDEAANTDVGGFVLQPSAIFPAGETND